MSVIEIVGGAILLVASLVIVFLTLMQSTPTVRACPVPSTAVWAVPTMHV